MGWEEEAFEDEDDVLREAAEEIAIRARILKRCPLHEEIVHATGQDNYEVAYRIANKLVTEEDSLVAPFEGNRRKLTDLIKSICDEYMLRCPICAKNAES